MSVTAELWGVLNSDFWTSLVGAGAGALAGAWGAQLIGEASARRMGQIQEIRSVNAAVAVCGSIINTLAALKRQHVGPMWERWQKGRELLDEHASGPAARTQPFRFQADFMSLLPINLPDNQLREIIFKDVSADPRILATFLLLSQAISNLNESLDQRNDLIEAIRSVPNRTDEMTAHFYFGIPTATGQTDRRYADVMAGVSAYTDDSLAFSVQLAKWLVDRANVVAREIGKRAPRVSRIDFADLEASGLLPDPKEHADLLQGLAKA